MGRNILCPSKPTLNQLKMFLLIKKKKGGKCAGKLQITTDAEDTVIGDIMTLERQVRNCLELREKRFSKININ